MTAPKEPPRRMRRLTPLLLLVGLSGCTGLGVFIDHTFTNPGRNPNVPMADSENVRRVLGLDPAIQPIESEPGNVWPKFDTHQPTLEDIEKNPGREDARGFGPTVVPGARPGLPAGTQPVPAGGQPAPSRRGSSTPPDSGQTQPAVPRAPRISVPPPLPRLPGDPRPPGGVVDTPQGPAVDSGGTNSYRQYNIPGSPGSIVVPNGNGTSTVIQPNGTIQTIPTPR